MACYWGKCGDMAIQRVREDGMLLGEMWGYGYTAGTWRWHVTGGNVGIWLYRGYV